MTHHQDASCRMNLWSQFFSWLAEASWMLCTSVLFPIKVLLWRSLIFHTRHLWNKPITDFTICSALLLIIAAHKIPSTWPLMSLRERQRTGHKGAWRSRADNPLEKLQTRELTDNPNENLFSASKLLQCFSTMPWKDETKQAILIACCHI